VLVDTNVVLDVLLQRQPHATDSTALLAAIERGELSGLLGATSVTTNHYLVTKSVGAGRARKHVSTLLELFGVAPVTEQVLRRALDADFVDYEDAVLHEAAAAAGADAIVTRNAADFRRARLPVYDPAKLLALLRAG
jgi:predicted nucleic acid-binding protein